MYILFAIIILTSLGLLLGFSLAIAGKYLKVEADPLVEKVESLMPGSQCGQCGFPGCRPAAEALVKGEAQVTLCPPGGTALVEQLAKLLNINVDLSATQDNEPIMLPSSNLPLYQIFYNLGALNYDIFSISHILFLSIYY